MIATVCLLCKLSAVVVAVGSAHGEIFSVNKNATIYTVYECRINAVLSQATRLTMVGAYRANWMVECLLDLLISSSLKSDINLTLSAGG